MVEVALVDFGDTLADQTFMRRDCERFPTWTDAFNAAFGEHGEAWDTGGLSSREFATHMAARLDADADDAHRYMLKLCRGLRFHPAINEAVRRRRDRGEPQALVTVNPDIIDDIAAHYGLLDMFDVVVASWEHGTVDKAALCHRALDLLGGLQPADAVLVDNIADNVGAWVACGGHGYLFRDDETFAADTLAGRVPGFIPSDAASIGHEADADG